MNLNSTGNVRIEGDNGLSYRERIAVVCHSKKMIVVNDYKWSVTTSKHSGMILRHFADLYPDYTIVRRNFGGSMNNFSEAQLVTPLNFKVDIGLGRMMSHHFKSYKLKAFNADEAKATAKARYADEVVTPLRDAQDPIIGKCTSCEVFEA